jgi:WXG100 family type VII secretion target
MPGEQIRSDFDQLNEIQRRWSAEADMTRNAIQSLNSCMDRLKGGDWYGDSATKFFNEMDSAVMPALQRLEQALREAQNTTSKIADSMRDAESQCSGVLNGAGI